MLAEVWNLMREIISYGAKEAAGSIARNQKHCFLTGRQSLFIETLTVIVVSR